MRRMLRNTVREGPEHKGPERFSPLILTSHVKPMPAERGLPISCQFSFPQWARCRQHSMGEVWSQHQIHGGREGWKEGQRQSFSGSLGI